MSSHDDGRITPQMLLLGRGVKALAPGRRLFVDAVGILMTLAVLAGVTVAFDLDRSHSVLYASIYLAVQLLIMLARYVSARLR